MAISLWTRVASTALCMAAGLAAQDWALPKFDVVSIHAVPPNSPLVMDDIDFTPILPGGQFVDMRTSLLFMIATAYDVKNPSNQLVGLPHWAEGQAYAVAAKAAPSTGVLSPAENSAQVRLMMRAMLADRFHLQLHTETRQERVYQLEATRGGIKIPEVDPPVPPATAGPVGAAIGDQGGRMIGNKSTMAGLARALTIFLKRPVIDRTGLKGYYDFDVHWSAPETLDGPHPAVGFGAAGAGMLISNLESQLGLRLTTVIGPVEYWVVDHVEPPTGN